MKPLTIEELKALPVGDWVWVEILDENLVSDYFPKQSYLKKIDNGNTTFWFDNLIISGWDTLRYWGYGTKWVAYKNKEQAEAKGEIVELPCKLGQKLYAIDDGDIREYFAGEVNVCEDGGFVFETPKLFPHRLTFGKDIFIDKNEAEEHFAQIKGKDK